MGYNQVALALTYWFEQSSTSNSLHCILIVSVYSRTAYFDICIICLSCSSTTCSDSPGACRALQKCFHPAQDAGLSSQLSGSSSLITVSSLLMGFGQRLPLLSCDFSHLCLLQLLFQKALNLLIISQPYYPIS